MGLKSDRAPNADSILGPMADQLPIIETSAVDADAGTGPARFQIEGMHCAGCAAGLQQAISGVVGVTAASVDFTSGLATVEGEVAEASVLAAIQRRGFSGNRLSPGIDVAAVRTDIERRQTDAVRRWRRRAVVGVGLWLPLETLHWTLGHAGHAWMPWVMLAGSAIVLAVAGGGFYASAWSAARRRTTNMDTLIALGATTAFAWSVVVLLMQRLAVDPGPWLARPFYFAEAAALLGIISIGHWIEAAATARAGAAVRELLELQPDEAELVEPDGGVRRMPSAALESGDRVLVRPGGRIPIDGTLVEGVGDIDESLVTGEPLPVRRAVGDAVVAGTVNTTGRLVVEASVDGRHTTVARIAELVRHAQGSRAPIQRLADRISAIFVPAVVSIAVAAALGWGVLGGDWETGVVSAVTVLIISCPCALGLATPMAVMVGAGEASRRGILVKTAGDLEAAGRIRTVAFDKTGTLTEGRPTLGAIELTAGDADSGGSLAEVDVLRLAATVESSSEHPIARAIVDAARARGATLGTAAEFRATAGVGVEGTVDGRRVEVVRDERASCRVIVDGDEVARLHVVDSSRADAAETVSRLRRLGLGVRMITGDRRDAAIALGRDLGLAPEEIIADATPESKLQSIAKAGAGTAMVGDGINDAAALAQATLGIAMAGGTEAAIESAGVVVPADRVGGVADAIELARRTLQTIRQNLFLAFFYNALAIPAAAFGLLGVHGPLIAAGAMACSDISVIGNALRLRARLARERRGR